MRLSSEWRDWGEFMNWWIGGEWSLFFRKKYDAINMGENNIKRTNVLIDIIVHIFWLELTK